MQTVLAGIYDGTMEEEARKAFADKGVAENKQKFPQLTSFSSASCRLLHCSCSGYASLADYIAAGHGKVHEEQRRGFAADFEEDAANVRGEGDCGAGARGRGRGGTTVETGRSPFVIL
eukprot:766761-Hanusia_phi.AAC.4